MTVGHTISMPGTAASVPQSRTWARTILDEASLGTPERRHDVEVIVSELATNAVRHTASGDPGGEFSLRLDLGNVSACIEVHDEGPADNDADLDLDDEGGRGVALVAALAHRSGYTLDGDAGVAWAVVDLGASDV